LKPSPAIRCHLPPSVDDSGELGLELVERDHVRAGCSLLLWLARWWLVGLFLVLEMPVPGGHDPVVREDPAGQVEEPRPVDVGGVQVDAVAGKEVGVEVIEVIRYPGDLL
jgi:hypothetical protein